MNAALPLTARSIPADYRLRMPGPAAIPERVRAATALPILSHRGPEFRGILDEVTTLMRGVLGTTQEVFLLGGSGTGGMEAALVNVLSTGDAVLVIENGQFGERFSVDRRRAAGAARSHRKFPGARCRMQPRSPSA